MIKIKIDKTDLKRKTYENQIIEKLDVLTEGHELDEMLTNVVYEMIDWNLQIGGDHDAK